MIPSLSQAVRIGHPKRASAPAHHGIEKNRLGGIVLTAIPQDQADIFELVQFCVLADNY